MDSTRRNKWLFFGLLCLCAGASVEAKAFSTPTITEVLYDALGSDEGKEWIEVTNFTDTPLELGKYTLLESGAHHRISPGPLGVGQSAVLTKDVAAFAAAYPGFSGPIFKVSFSLSNTGETLVLKNASTTVDSFSYTATLGGQGDSNSLHRTPTGISPGAPTPGRYTPNITPLPVVEKPRVAKEVVTEKSVKEEVPIVTSAAVPSDVQRRPPTNTREYFTEGLLGLAALVLLGVASVWYAKSMPVPTAAKETKLRPDEFEVE